MLVLRRRAGEVFLIGDHVEIEILEIEANQVKIGIRAPKDVTVLRKEIASTRDANLASAQDVAAKPLEALAKKLRKRPSDPH
jgi:carbon storage regulator